MIDKAFTEMQSGLTAYWTEIAAGNLNGTATTVSFNINNHTPYNVAVQSGQLVVEFDVINSDGTALSPIRIGETSASTSWGTENNAHTGTTTYNGNTLTSGEVTWTAGTSLPGQKASAQDNTVDIAISLPGNTIIGATLRQVPLVKPVYADIVAANPTMTFTPECQAYYDAKAAVPLAITIAGPSIGQWREPGSVAEQPTPMSASSWAERSCTPVTPISGGRRRRAAAADERALGAAYGAGAASGRVASAPAGRHPRRPAERPGTRVRRRDPRRDGAGGRRRGRLARRRRVAGGGGAVPLSRGPRTGDY